MLGAIASGIGSLVGAGASLYASGQQKNAAEQNFALSKENLEWQKEMQYKTWEREDDAVQRRVNDLRAAGLSPVLAAGSAASSSSPIKTEAPQLDSSWSDSTAKALTELGKGPLQAFDTSVSIAQRLASVKQQEETIAKTAAERDLIALQQAKILADTDYVKQNTELLPTRRNMMLVDMVSKQHNIQNIQTKNKMMKQEMALRDYDYGLARLSGVRYKDSPSMYGAAYSISRDFNALGSLILRNGSDLIDKLSNNILK